MMTMMMGKVSGDDREMTGFVCPYYQPSRGSVGLLVTCKIE